MCECVLFFFIDWTLCVMMMMDMITQEGIRGLYRGFGVTLLRAIPSNAVIFGTYEIVNRSIRDF